MPKCKKKKIQLSLNISTSSFLGAYETKIQFFLKKKKKKRRKLTMDSTNSSKDSASGVQLKISNYQRS